MLQSVCQQLHEARLALGVKLASRLQNSSRTPWRICNHEARATTKNTIPRAEERGPASTNPRSSLHFHPLSEPLTTEPAAPGGAGHVIPAVIDRLGGSHGGRRAGRARGRRRRSLVLVGARCRSIARRRGRRSRRLIRVLILLRLLLIVAAAVVGLAASGAVATAAATAAAACVPATPAAAAAAGIPATAAAAAAATVMTTGKRLAFAYAPSGQCQYHHSHAESSCHHLVLRR